MMFQTNPSKYFLIFLKIKKDLLIIQNLLKGLKKITHKNYMNAADVSASSLTDASTCELLIIFDYFNSSLSNIIYKIMENMKIDILRNIEYYEQYEHINKMFVELISEKCRYVYTALNNEKEVLLLAKIKDRYPNHPSLYKYDESVDLDTDYFIDKTINTSDFSSELEINLYVGSLLLLDVKTLGFDEDFIDECIKLRIFHVFEKEF